MEFHLLFAWIHKARGPAPTQPAWQHIDHRPLYPNPSLALASDPLAPAFATALHEARQTFARLFLREVFRRPAPGQN
eukprot:1391517-Amorphochlora_amoeboformis.AAC.1